jgi:hypothetical protein
MERFRAAEEGGVIGTEELRADLRAVTDRIDRILGEVRSPAVEQRARSEKTLV